MSETRDECIARRMKARRVREAAPALLAAVIEARATMAAIYCELAPALRAVVDKLDETLRAAHMKAADRELMDDGCGNGVEACRICGGTEANEAGQCVKCAAR